MKKFQPLQQTLLNSDFTTAYHLSRWKFWEHFPEKTFPFYHFWNSTGSLLDYAGKNFGMGETFQLFSQSFWAGVSELKPICPFKQFQSPEDYWEPQGNNLENFSNFQTILKPCRTQSEKFSAFRQKILGGIFKADSHLGREKNWKTIGFLKDFGTLTKSSWAF